MNDDIRKILDDTYDDSREDSIRTMIGDFYSRKMLSVTVLIWFWAIVFCVAAGYFAMKFFETDETQSQIMYASLFICLVQFIGLMKVFAWQMMARNSIKREVKRLEIHIGELTKALDKATQAGSH
jgi:hypothetical protein